MPNLFLPKVILFLNFQIAYLTRKIQCDYDKFSMKFIPARVLQKGFTLIELLVVIGILGILAAALIATIDPLEQLKKAQDSNTKNAAVEYVNALTRYYATHNVFPWDPVADGGAGCNTDTVPSGPLDGAEFSDPTTGCTAPLIAEKELKSDFANANYLSKINITFDAAESSIIGCFQPESKSQSKDRLTNYNVAGVQQADGECVSTGGTTACYWCAR